MLAKSNPDEAQQLLELAQQDVLRPLEDLRKHGEHAAEAPRHAAKEAK